MFLNENLKTIIIIILLALLISNIFYTMNNNNDNNILKKLKNKIDNRISKKILKKLRDNFENRNNRKMRYLTPKLSDDDIKKIKLNKFKRKNSESFSNKPNDKQQQALEKQEVIYRAEPQVVAPVVNPVMQPRMTDPVYIRDNQVLNDKLYPPLARTERPQFDLLMNFINNQPDIYNMYTRGPPDTFRPVGYLTPKDGNQTIDSTLILYGRAKYPNSDLGEFYITSSNKMSDIKVPLTQNNTNIRKITDLPTDVNISGNLLAGNYNFTELPKGDLTYPYI